MSLDKCRLMIAGFSIFALIGCSTTEPAPPPTPGSPPAPEPPPAPWTAAALPESAVPPVYLEVWSSAANRDECRLLAFAAVEPPGAVPRPANFAGGWAVAYDLPDQRSAFGVAGTGTTFTPDTYDDWPRRLVWADGSRAGYGPEGGTGPNQLAYLQVAGQECLYNVWSRLGVDHLERLLGALRFVSG